MSRPNAILIVADQHRWDCSAYAGNPDLRTPNLDALAAHGINFSQALCQYPASVPSRATLLTGRYACSHGVHSGREGLPAGAATLPALLRDAGYSTACVGKLHAVAAGGDYGFETTRLVAQAGEEDDYHQWLKEQDLVDEVDEWDQGDRKNAPQEYWDTFGALPSTLSEGQHSTTWIGNAAVRFIQTANEPFFLMVGFVKPRHPFDPPEPWNRLYDPDKLTLPPGWCLPVPDDDVRHGGLFDPRQMTEPKFRRVLAYYYASISHIDHQIGRLLATLTSRGFTNNLFVYCADHGDYMGQHGLIAKNDAPLYDSLLRVPLLIAGLRGQRRGAADPSLAQITDIVPTILDASGLDIPPGVDGISLVPSLRRSRAVLRQEAFCEGPNQACIIRTQQYKLVQSEREDVRAFYDLREDPHEFENLYGRAGFAERQGELENALRRVQDSLLEKRSPS